MSCLRSSLRFGSPLTCRSTMRFPRAGRVSLAAVGSIAVALAAAACSSGGSTTPATAAAHQETTNIVVGALPVVDTAGLYLAQQQGTSSRRPERHHLPHRGQPGRDPGNCARPGGHRSRGELRVVLPGSGGGQGPVQGAGGRNLLQHDTFEILALPSSHITSAAGLAARPSRSIPRTTSRPC